MTFKPGDKAAYQDGGATELVTVVAGPYDTPRGDTVYLTWDDAGKPFTVSAHTLWPVTYDPEVLVRYEVDGETLTARVVFGPYWDGENQRYLLRSTFSGTTDQVLATRILGFA